jgi:tetratricopeptide (TPR) repeat protein
MLTPMLADAGPHVLSGHFRADSYGTLALSTEGEGVTGAVVEGGVCKFDAGRQVLEGDFEGGVLVGKVWVCLTGNMCPQEQQYPILAFYNEADRTLVAHVRLRAGCQSAALKDGRLVLLPVAKEPEAAPAAGTGASSSASSLASKRTPRDAEAAKKANDEGKKHFLENKFHQAAQSFEISLSHDSGDKNWMAYMGRGSSRLKMGLVEGAIEDLERSRQANSRLSAPGSRDTRILYMLGCAYAQKGEKKKALDYLRQAVKAGYPLHESADNDRDLKQHLGSEQEFVELVKKAKEKKQQAQSRGTPPGTP